MSFKELLIMGKIEMVVELLDNGYYNSFD